MQYKVSFNHIYEKSKMGISLKENFAKCKCNKDLKPCEKVMGIILPFRHE